MNIKSILFAALFVIIASTQPSFAYSHKTWGDISDYSVAILGASALLVPSVKQDWQGLRQAAFSLGTAEGASLLGKALIHEQRPDHSDNNSFPSGHATFAFASATTLYRRYGWQIGFPAYAIATLAGTARVKAKKHHWYDVVAGAAIGSAAGWYFTDPYNDKVQLTPWADSHGAGMTVSARW